MKGPQEDPAARVTRAAMDAIDATRDELIPSPAPAGSASDALEGQAGPTARVDPQELALVRRAQAGEVAAVRALLATHREPLYAIAFGYLGNREEALDAVQEALAKALRAVRRFDPRRPVSAWLARITRNVCLDRLRRLKLRRHASLEERREAGFADPRHHAPGPESRLLNAELRVKLVEAVRTLRPVEQEAIVLRDVLEWSYAEIESYLDLGHGTVASLIHRARAKLRRALAPYLAHQGLPETHHGS